MEGRFSPLPHPHRSPRLAPTPSAGATGGPGVGGLGSPPPPWGRGSAAAAALGPGAGGTAGPAAAPRPDFCGLTAVSIPGWQDTAIPTPAPGWPPRPPQAPPGAQREEGLGRPHYPPPPPIPGGRVSAAAAERDATCAALFAGRPPSWTTARPPLPTPAPHCERLPAPGSPSLHSEVQSPPTSSG
ncbi:unnamed protein product [Rangifer tarandus platyrhynchus]|uniref:Uncharacterized protein n=1 Tax=Rangifer tarandus platyrhynchus TaxID=3082113 RepID=A0ABN8Z4Y8_RANTA|nr:unnamed protein product [Rangifer tarandus platyrhynchus]